MDIKTAKKYLKTRKRVKHKDVEYKCIVGLVLYFKDKYKYSAQLLDKNKNSLIQVKLEEVEEIENDKE